MLDSKIGLNFTEAARASSAEHDDGAQPQVAARSHSNTPSTQDAVGGSAASKVAAPGLGRGGSVPLEDGMSADLLADNSRLRAQLENQKEVLAQTTEALEAMKSQLDLRSRKNVENMSEAEFAKAAATVSGTVYDKKTEVQAPSAPTATVQVCFAFRTYFIILLMHTHYIFIILLMHTHCTFIILLMHTTPL